MIQYYELIYIVPVKFAGGEFEKIQNKIKEIIQKEKGQIAREKNLGKKKLAYPIKHNFQGFYVINEFETETEKIKTINEKIKLVPEVIRHLIFKKKKLTEEEIENSKKKKKSKESKMADQFNIEKQIENSGAQPEKEEASTDEIKTNIEKVKVENIEKTESENEKEKIFEKKKEDKKIRLEDLDEKLDTIINDNLI
jgi:small subunit ribosomal protein S6